MIPILDSSGNGNHGTSDPLGAGGITPISGLVAGNAAIDVTVTSTPGILASAPTLSGIMAGDFWCGCWFHVNSGTDSGIGIGLLLFFESPFGTQIFSLAVTPSGGEFAVKRHYDVSLDDVILSDTGTIGPGAHFVFLTYQAGTDTYTFYLDGAPFGTPKNGVNAIVDVLDPTIVYMGAVVTAQAVTFDEVAYGTGLPSSGNVAALFAAASTSFSAYSAAQLAMTPGGYYHLDGVFVASLPLNAVGITESLAIHQTGVPTPPPPSFGNIAPLTISQPQLTRMNSRLRAPRNSERLNLELYSTAYDIYKLYYKYDVIENELVDDINYIYDPTLSAPDDLPFDDGFTTILPMITILAEVADLQRRVRNMELARRNEL